MDNSFVTQAKPVILVVDPNPLTMTGVASALHLAGYEVHCARDHMAAAKAGRDLTLDLIVCDVIVENVSGRDICREIQAEALNREVPVIFFTTNQGPDIIRRTDDAGGVYYLRKPIDPTIMLELVERALWMPHLVKNRLTRHDAADAKRPAMKVGQRPVVTTS